MSSAGAYPSRRHQVDISSWLIVGSHIASGLLIIYGGAALWMAARLWSILPLWAVKTLAVAALVHSFTNVGMLRKVAGIRTITVRAGRI